MTRMARVALAAILTVSAAWSQADPFLGGGGGAGAGGGEHPGGAGAGDPGLLTRPDFDAVLGAAHVNRWDWLDQGFFAPGGDTRVRQAPLQDPASNLRILPELSEAVDDLVRGQGVDPGSVRNEPPTADPAPGTHAGGALSPVGALVPRWWQRRQGRNRRGWDPRRQFGGADPPLIEIPEPPEGPARLVDSGRRPGLDTAGDQELIDEAAAEVISNRLARGIDPNRRANRPRAPAVRDRRGQLGLILLDLLEGQEVGEQGARFLREHVEEAISLLGESRREPREGDGALQQSIDASACAIVDWIGESLRR